MDRLLRTQIVKDGIKQSIECKHRRTAIGHSSVYSICECERVTGGVQATFTIEDLLVCLDCKDREI